VYVYHTISRESHVARGGNAAGAIEGDIGLRRRCDGCNEELRLTVQ
jgi:hypothetical protein